MMYFASDMMFGDEIIACKRHFSSADEMNSKIVDNWNKTVYDSDIVYILGGVGDLSYLNSLCGIKNLMLSDMEDKYVDSYLNSISSQRDRIYDYDMYSKHLESTYGVSNVHYSKSILKKRYTGKLARLTTLADFKRDDIPVIVGGIGNEYQRLFKTGVNSNIFVNGMYPISDIEVEGLLKHVDKLI